MSILGKYTEKTDQKYDSKELLSQDSDNFEMPAVTRADKNSIPLDKGIKISTAVHTSTIGGLWLLMLILAYFGITLHLFDKPKPKVNDIEFVLVDKEEKPKDPNTKFRADKNSRTGGINDPKKPVSMFFPTALK